MTEQFDILGLDQWGIDYTPPLVISGPCSAESEEQLMEVARGVKGLKVHLLRAGIWKPRTRPGSFEGVGARGLQWLKAAGAEAGIPVTCEVAKPEHVEECLKAGIDVLWIGARTTTNPFAVQDLADALAGADVPVMVKNPINPDIELWIGAIERVHRAGITRLAAIHRGFSSFNEKVFRNAPKWRIAIELKRRIPTLPVICDPSHLTGSREYIPAVARKAMDLVFDGLMIEAHPDPANALSDSKQQYTPRDLGDLLGMIEERRLTSMDADYQTNIEQLRRQVDQLDAHIIDQMAARMDLAKEIGLLKRKNKVAIFQPDYWKKTITGRISAGKDKGLSEHFMLRLFQYIHEESIRHQEVTYYLESLAEDDVE